MGAALRAFVALVSALDRALAAWREAKQREAGRRDERAASQARTVRNAEERNAVDRDVAREPDPAGRLYREFSRR